MYVLHPPGGVAPGDLLDLQLQAGSDAHAVITTPGATKFYRTESLASTVTQRIALAPNAILEWLPQENIFFNGCNVSVNTRVDLSLIHI